MTGAPRIDALIEEIRSLSPNERRRLTRQGFRLATSTPAQLAGRIATEVARWREMVAFTGMRLFEPGGPELSAAVPSAEA